MHVASSSFMKVNFAALSDAHGKASSMAKDMRDKLTAESNKERAQVDEEIANGDFVTAKVLLRRLENVASRGSAAQIERLMESSRRG